MLRQAAGNALTVLVLCATAGWAGPKIGPQTAEETRSTVAPQDWWTQVRHRIAESEYHVKWMEGTRPPGTAASEAGVFANDGDAGVWQAANRAHNMRICFTRRGPRVVRRTEHGPSWVWGLELVGYRWAKDEGGRRKHETAFPSAPAVQNLAGQGNRMEYRRGDLVEWYINDPGGLEQGFTITAPPRSRIANPRYEIRIDLAVRGDLIPLLSADGEEVAFLHINGLPVIRYGHLKVHDAAGRVLPARLDLQPADADGEGLLSSAFQPSSFRLQIRVDVEGDIAYPIVVDPLATTYDWLRRGLQDNAHLGASVSTAGDVNGDGYDDVIVGAPDYDNSEVNDGRAFVFHGSESGLPADYAWTASSDKAGSRFGSSVATAGDVNGDGFDDVIVGADAYTGDHIYEGRVYVYHGSSSGLSSSANWDFESDKNSGALGASVSTAGDIDGDGFDDVIVGAPGVSVGDTKEGRAYVFLGSASGLAAAPVWSRDSNKTLGRFGSSVSTAGDVNGDGFDDMIIGASGWSAGQSGEGKAFLFNGSAWGVVDGVSWLVESNVAGARFGSSVASAGDVDGDGYDDVIVGAGGIEKAFVYHGSPSGLSDTAEWTSDMGGCVGTAGDVNEDGYDDVIVGAPTYDGNNQDEGRAAVFCGSAFGLSQTADWSIENNQNGAQYGASVSTAGDINGDGASEFIVGVPYGGAADEGLAYLFLGTPKTRVNRWPLYR